ncbi:immunoglobulin-like domain-containing protein [Clostridioides difficile]
MKNKKLVRSIAIVLFFNLATNSICSAESIKKFDNEYICMLEKESAIENLLKNSGFEEESINGRIPSWKVWNGGNKAPGIDLENAYEGNKCAYIVDNSSIAQVINNLKPHTTYEYKCYIKLENNEDSAIIGVKDYGGEEIKKNVTGNTYTEYTIKFTTGNQSKAEIYLWDGTGLSKSGKAFIDNVSLVETADKGDAEVKLNMNELKISVGERYELLSKVIPNSVVDKGVTYTSNNENVVTVDSNGIITAVGEGEAVITATPDFGGASSTCKVNVTKDKQPWYTDNESRWTLVMEDEFEGDQLDTSKWTVRGKEYKTYHRSDMVSVEDGKLKLGIEREPDGQVVLGRIDNHDENFSENKTKFDQKYGFFEVSAKIPPTEQTYFAFWMFNYPGVFNVDGTGREGTEIDITETVFQGDSTESTLHWDGYERWHKSESSHRKSAPNIHDGFHRYGLEWDEDTLKFYFDGKLTWTYEGPAVPWVKEILILSSGLGMWGEGNINNADLPYVAEVDWVRVYTKDGYDDRTDGIKPILYGLNDIKIAINSDDDLMSGVWAIDNKDDESELSKYITIDEKSLDRSAEGIYNVIYSVEDKSGNTESKEREVYVVEESEVKNKVFNGKFKDQTLDKWSVSNQTGQSIDSNNAGIVNDEIQGSYTYLSQKKTAEQVVNIKPDTTYRLRAKVRGENASSRIEIGTEMYGREKQQAFAKGNEWQEIEVEFTTDIEHTTALVYIHNPNDNEKIFFDDVIVEEIDNRDKDAPIITGISDIRIPLGSEFDPKYGVNANDNNDGDLTVWVDVKGKVNVNKAGTYTLTYYVKDIALNETIVNRIVTVYDENFTVMNTAPEIHGAENIKITKGNSFDITKGVTANDKEDGDITSNIIIEGKIDVNIVGEYKIVYRVEDSKGAIKTIERIVSVVEEEVIEVDKSKLTNLINKAEKLDPSRYTNESWKVLNDAILKAKLVLEDRQATIEQVKKAEEDLESAINGLVYKENNDKENNDKENNDQKPVLPQTGGVVSSLFAIAIGTGLMYIGSKNINKKIK